MWSDNVTAKRTKQPRCMVSAVCCIALSGVTMAGNSQIPKTLNGNLAAELMTQPLNGATIINAYNAA